MFPYCFPGKGKWIVTLIVAISSAQSGLLYMWPGVGLNYVREGSAGFTITEQEHANILNTFLASKIVGVLAVSYCMDRLGRKWTLTAFTFLAVLGWLALIFGTNAIWLVCARIFSGLYVSVQMSLVPVVIGETMEPVMRGSLNSLSVLFSLSANFLVSFFIPFGYFWFNIITGLPCLLQFVASMFMVETPYYLLLKGEKEKGRESILWLRGYCSDELLNNMEAHLQPSVKSGKLSSLLEKSSQRAFIIVIPLVIVMALGSPEVIFNYFFVLMPSQPIPPELAYSATSFVCAIALIFSTFIIERLGRRLTTSIAFTGGCIFQMSLAVWYFQNSDHFAWFPPVGLWLFSFFYYLALETLPRLMLSELFSLQVKGTASVVVTTIKAIVTITLNQSFYPIRNSFGTWFYFAFSGGFLGLGALISNFILPETKGKSLELIQDALANGDIHEKKAVDDNTMVSSSTRV